MNFNKKSAIFALVILISHFAFGYDSIMAGEKKLKYFQTEFLDIIFTQNSEQSAKVLAQKGDEIYLQVAQKFNQTEAFRLPVVISSSSDNSNAYFSSAPFNHIVIFDSPQTEDFAVFSQNILNTFRHELIHAITYNLNNKGWTKTKQIFGDVYTGSVFSISPFDAEGATVSVESEFGEGRLNNEYHKQTVLQSKIENKFPSFTDVKGAKDAFPSTTECYYFGGAFADFLQKKYGMQKYAEFWYKSCNLPNFSNIFYNLTLKQIYEKSAVDLWNEFQESIKIPEKIIYPDKNENFRTLLKDDFFMHKKLNIKKIKVVRNNLFYFDKNSKTARKLNLSEPEKKPVLIFKQQNLIDFDVSDDERFISESYADSGERVLTNRINILDTKTKKSFKLSEKHIKDGSFVHFKDEYYFACTKTSSQYYELLLYKIIFSKSNKIKKLDFIYKIKTDFEQCIFSPTSDENGNLYFIFKDKLVYTIKKLNLETKELSSFPLPHEKMKIQNLCANQNGKLSFNYTIPGQMPKLGFCTISNNLENAEFLLSEINLSGSIFQPQFFDKKIIYKAAFYDFYAIFEVPEVFFDDLKKFQTLKIKTTYEKINEEKSEKSALEAKPFSAVKYAFSGPNGFFLPVSLTTTYSFNKSFSDISSVILPIGISYFSSTPWTMPIWNFSAGFNPFTKSAALQLGIYGGSYETDFISYDIRSQVEFDKYGYKQSNFVTTFSLKNQLNNLFYTKINENFKILEGRTSFSSAYNNFRWLFGLSKTTFAFGNIHSTSQNYYDISGFELSADYKAEYLALSKNILNYVLNQNIALSLSLDSCKILPVQLKFSLFPEYQTFLNISSGFVLFCKELQKSNLVLYSNRISLTAGYAFCYVPESTMPLDFTVFSNTGIYFNELFNGKMHYYDEGNITFNYMLTPNITSLARTNFQFKLNTSLLFRISPSEENKYFGFSICGISLF